MVGTQTPQGYTVEQLYKAGLAKQDKQITRDKVTVYQINSDKPKDHMMLNGVPEKSDVEENSNISDSKPINEIPKSSDAVISSDVTRTTTYDTATTTISNTALDSSVRPTALTMSLATNITASSNTSTTDTVAVPFPTTTSTIVPLSTVPSSTAPIVISDSTLTITATKDTASSPSGSQPNSIPSEESTAISSKNVDGTEFKIGQKRPATDMSGASTPKRTREMLRSSLQQLLEGKSSVSEDDTPKTPTKSTNITGLNNLAVICYS